MKKGLGPWLFAHLLPPIARAHARATEAWRRALLGGLEGKVLELGPGTGVNLAYYGPGVQWLGLEPNPYLHPQLQRALAERGLKGEILLAQGEAIPLPDESVDAAVATLVLCSVQDPRKALKEVLRVLKPGRPLVFLEHVAAPPGTGLRRAQDLLAPLWAHLADGCHPNRETLALLREVGFHPIQAQAFHLPYPLVSPHLAGVAYKPLFPPGPGGEARGS